MSLKSFHFHAVFWLCVCIIITQHISLGASVCTPLGKVVPLRYTPRASEYPNALESGGKIFGPGDRILPEDMKGSLYVYVIASYKGKEYLAWGEVAAGELQPGKNLITHTALQNQLRKFLGVEPEFLSQGQVDFLNGYPREADNKSGTGRGNITHLNFGVSKLIEHGVPIEQGTRRTDYSHSKASARADYRTKVDRDPKLRQFRSELIQLHSRLFHNSPEFQGDRGRLNFDKLFNVKQTGRENLDLFKGFLKLLEDEGADFVTLKLSKEGYLIEDLLRCEDILLGKTPRNVAVPLEERQKKAEIESSIAYFHRIQERIPTDRRSLDTFFNADRIAARRQRKLDFLERQQVAVAFNYFRIYSEEGDQGLRKLLSMKNSPHSRSNLLLGILLALGEDFRTPALLEGIDH